MKRLLLAALVGVLATVPARGAPSLGFWEEGDPGTGHFVWQFESNRVLPVEIPGVASFNADPTVAQSVPSGVLEFGNVIGVTGNGVAYDAETGSFSSANPLDIHVKLNNFPALNVFKEVWVDVIGSGTIVPTNAIATTNAPDGGSVTFTYQLLSGPGPGTGADFGWRIFPNPSWEEIEFSLLPSAGALAILDSIHVDTICIPAPGALLLGTLGATTVGWLRARRRL